MTTKVSHEFIEFVHKLKHYLESARLAPDKSAQKYWINRCRSVLEDFLWQEFADILREEAEEKSKELVSKNV